MSDQRPRNRRLERAGLLILVGAVVVANIVLRWTTDVGPVARILLSLVLEAALAAGVVTALVRRPRR